MHLHECCIMVPVQRCNMGQLSFGKGMVVFMGVFSMDGPVMRFLNLLGNILTLHVLWLLYSLPLVTIGASTTALYHVSMQLVRKQDGYLRQSFHKSFRENFRQSAAVWLGILVFVFILSLDIRFASYLNNGLGRLMLIGCSLLLIPFLLTVLYIFPVQAKFENKIRDNLKNALLMSIRHLPLSLLLLFIQGSLFFLGFFFRPFMGVMLCCGAGLTAYLSSGIFVMIFRTYLPDEVLADLETSGERFN